MYVLLEEHDVYAYCYYSNHHVSNVYPSRLCLVVQGASTGTTTDMDFMFLIPNSIMQVLGIFIALYPIYKSKKLSSGAWYWALIFALLGFIGSVGSVPIYIYLSTFWSGLASFTGTVAQVSMSVQLFLLATAHIERAKQE